MVPLVTVACGEDELVDPSRKVKVVDSGDEPDDSGGSSGASSSSGAVVDAGGGSSSGSSAVDTTGNTSSGADITAADAASTKDAGATAGKLVKGKPTQLVEDNGALYLAVPADAADGRAFWTNATKRTVNVWQDGASFTMHTEPTGFLPWDAVVPGKTLYYAALGKSLYYLRKLPTKGGPVGTAASAKPTSPVQTPRKMASDGSYIYFVTGSGDGPTYVGLVRRLDPDEGELVDLVQYQKEPTAIDVDDKWVYWTTRQGAALWRMAKDGTGKPKVLVNDKTGAMDLVVSEGFVYYVNTPVDPQGTDGGTVVRAPFAGGLPVTLISGQQQPLALDVDAKDVFWVTRGTADKAFADGAVWRMSKGGGKASKVAEALAQPWDIAVSGGRVFWTCRGVAGVTGGLWGLLL